MTFRERAQAVLMGRGEECGIQSAATRLAQRRSICDAMREDLDLPYFPSPEEIAVAMGVRVIVAELGGGVNGVFDGEVLVMDPVLSPGDRRSFTVIAIAHHVLSAEVGGHSAADCTLLAAELTAPSELVCRGRIGWAIQHRTMPLWWLEAWEEAWIGSPSSRRCA